MSFRKPPLVQRGNRTEVGQACSRAGRLPVVPIAADAAENVVPRGDPVGVQPAAMATAAAWPIDPKFSEIAVRGRPDRGPSWMT